MKLMNIEQIFVNDMQSFINFNKNRENYELILSF